MFHWKKIAALCLAAFLLLTIPVFSASPGDSGAGTANTTEEAGEAVTEADETADDEAATDTAEKALTGEAVTEADETAAGGETAAEEIPQEEELRPAA